MLGKWLTRRHSSARGRLDRGGSFGGPLGLAAGGPSPSFDPDDATQCAIECLFGCSDTFAATVGDLFNGVLFDLDSTDGPMNCHGEPSDGCTKCLSSSTIFMQINSRTNRNLGEVVGHEFGHVRDCLDGRIGPGGDLDYDDAQISANEFARQVRSECFDFYGLDPDDSDYGDVLDACGCDRDGIMPHDDHPDGWAGGTCGTPGTIGQDDT